MLTIPEEIRNLLHIDGSKKNIRIHFPNGERSDICNDMIIKDSVKLTESLCSQETLNFGLCESPVFECSVVGCENVKGARIEVFCEIYCEPYVEGAVFRTDIQAYVYPIPYGTFVISECKRDADMQYRKITAYGPSVSEETVSDKEVLTRPYDVNYFSNISYSPNLLNVFAAALNLRKNTFSSESYIDVTDDVYPGGTPRVTENYFFKTYGYTNGFGNEFRWGFLCRAYAIKSDEDILYLREMYDDDYIVDIDDAIEELITNSRGKAKYFRSIIYSDVKNKIRNRFYYKYQDLDTDTYHVGVYCPYAIQYSQMSTGSFEPVEEYTVTFRDASNDKFYKVSNSQYPNINITFPREEIIDEDVIVEHTYRVKSGSIKWTDYLQSYIEIIGLFGLFAKDTSFHMVSLKQLFVQTPSSELYPGASTFPMGATGGKLLPNDYQHVWYDDEYTKPFGKIYVPYKNTSNVDVIFEYYLAGYDETSDVNSYQAYDLSSNEIIKSRMWTQAQIEDVCETIASNIEGVTYMPVEFTGRGLPYVEPGDTFEILTKSNDSITTIVLNRTLSGEQVLTDNYKSV